MRKIALFSLTLILALGAMGVGYALSWGNTLYIDGNVETGYIDAVWSVQDYWDTEIPEQNVSSVTATGEGTHTLTVIVNNGQRDIWYYVWFDITNIGSIPIHIGDFIEEYNTLPQDVSLTIDGYSGPNDDLTPWSYNVEVPPGDSVFGLISIYIHDTASQNSSYEFGYSIDYWQYNEPGPA